MNVVMHAMLGNAVVAAVLAGLALAVGRACRSPSVRHAAWVVVLLKLVTPPLLSFPLPVLPASWGEPPSDPASPTGGFLQSPPSPPGTSDSPAKGVVLPPAWWYRFRAAGAAPWALAVWVAGAAGWFVWQGRRILR